MARKPLIAGNWKMNLNHLEAISVVQKLAFALPKDYYDKVDVAVIPPFTDIRSVQTLVDGDKLRVTYGAQDISTHDSGAYTGEIAPSMLSKLGCSWVIVGQSERRDYHSETNEIVAAKAKKAFDAGMTPIVCVGESLDVREAGEHVSFVVDQVKESLAGLSKDEIAKSVIAYEPIWAIGTGKTASASDAQEVCHAIRGALAELTDEETASSIRVLYGGSMKTGNVSELIAEQDIDGGLDWVSVDNLRGATGLLVHGGRRATSEYPITVPGALARVQRTRIPSPQLLPRPR